MRKALSMLTAIFVILLMSTVASFIINLSGKISKETGGQYQQEQAILYAKSYTELAVMAASSRDCIDYFTGFIGEDTAGVNEGEGYRVRVDVQYIGNELNGIAGCNTIGDSNITTAISKASIIVVDTYVRYRDVDVVAKFINNGNTVNATNLPWVTYHRRTLQRL